jgi:hypothetical protein
MHFFFIYAYCDWKMFIHVEFFFTNCDCRIVYDKILKKLKIVIVKCSFVHD